MPDWTWLLLAGLTGAACASLVPIAILAYYFAPNKRTYFETADDEDHLLVPLKIPEAVLNQVTRGVGSTPEGTLNAVIQFIFQQSSADTTWICRKMTNELSEMLTKTASGKIFESLTLRSLEVGSEFPSFNNLCLVNGELEEGGARLRSVDLTFDVFYEGNFKMDVDAVMMLGKFANVSFTVQNLSGKVRVMFRSNPYTHWAIAFDGPPRLGLRVLGKFQGRQLKPRLAAFIASQIQRAIAQRHTLPHYKIRYKPFFSKSDPGSEDTEEGPTPNGKFTMRLMEVSRLHWPAGVGTVKASLAVDSHAWVSYHRGIIVLDVVMPSVQGQLGLVCCQGVGGVVLVDTVQPMSAAYRADLRRDDVIIAIDNKPVINVAQVPKLLRIVERRAITIRIQRGRNDVTRTDTTEVKRKSNFSLRRVSEVMEGVRFQGTKNANKTTFQDTDTPAKSNLLDIEAEDQSKIKVDSSRQVRMECAPTTSSSGFGLRKRRCSVENKSSDSSAGSTPTNSGSSTPLKQTNISKTKTEIPTIRTDSTECRTSPDSALEEDIESETGGPRASEQVEICQMHWTPSVELKHIIEFNHEAVFKLNENHRYLNINLWLVVSENEEVLLGYLNLPLADLLQKCQDSTVPNHTKRYHLLPPDIDIKFSKTHKLSSHPGFEPGLCFGDALLWWHCESTAPPRTPRQATSPQVSPVLSPQRTLSRTRHVFVRTHFNRSTQCDFCNKKIWLKDAMQCVTCGLSCHKKCVTKCQETSPCLSKEHELVPTLEADTVNPDSDEDIDRKDHDEGGGAMSALMSGLRRAGSAHSLSAPKCSSSSRSLPPSPSHTPRKQSLDRPAHPFTGVAAAWLARGHVAPLLDQVLRSGQPPDALLAAARDSAPDLAAELTAQQIHDMLSAVREELSSEETGKSGGGGGDEARACALSSLMLHCCAAAQLAQQKDAT